MMTLTAFQNGLDHWGSRLEDWPARERRAAQRLLQAEPAAQECLAAAARVTASLHRREPSPTNEAFKMRLKTIPAHYPQPSRLPANPTTPIRWATGWLWGGGVALASSGVMAIGFLAGFGGLITLDANLVDWAALAYGSL